MILNSNTGSHDMYLPDRRARKAGSRRTAPPEQDSVIPNRNGTLEEKCVWMRQLQKQPKKPKRAIVASVRASRKTIACGIEDYGRMSPREFEAMLVRQAEDAARSGRGYSHE
jgi:hypothetical protein